MIYTIENTLAVGRPAKCFVNGNLVDNAFYADTVKGFVLYYPTPLKIIKNGDSIYSRRLKGVVTVEYINDN